MHIAVFTTHAASRRDPLGEVFARAYAAFVAAGGGPPVIRLICADNGTRARINAAVGTSKTVEPIARVLKRFPDLARLHRTVPNAEAPERSQEVLTTIAMDGTVEPIDPAQVQAIADGIPRSFPFEKIIIHLHIQGFGDVDALPTENQIDWQRSLMRAGVAGFGPTLRHCGVVLEDSWWVNGRQRSTFGMRIVNAAAGIKKLPPPPPEIAAALEACGKIRKTIQFPISVGPPRDFKTTEAGSALAAIIRTWRDRLPALAANMPHRVTHQLDQPRDTAGSGPKKPALEAAFKPMGYSIRGETGSFTLRRRTAANLTIELDVDVGTWGDQVLTHLRVIGMHGETPYRIALGLPASPETSSGEVRGVMVYGQMPIATPERWRMLTENLAALVAILERDFIPEIEAAAGPTPAWFQPETN